MKNITLENKNEKQQITLELNLQNQKLDDECLLEMNKIKTVRNVTRQDKNQILENLSIMGQEELFNLSLEIIRKDNRNTFDLEILQHTFSNIKFFQELQQKQGVETLLNCFRKIKLKEYSYKQVVIKQGDTGKEFYIILKGKVGVYIRSALYNNGLNKKIEKHPIMSEYAIDEQQEVNRMITGQSFGEIALLYETQRMASVVCLEDTILAVLVKEDFNEIIANAVQKQQIKKMDFISSLPEFEKISRRMLNMLIQSFLEENFTFKDIVYKEGSLSDKIFIIVKGEFKLYKKIQLQKDEVQGEYYYQQFNEKFIPSSKQANRQADIIVLGIKEIFGIECIKYPIILKALQDKKYRETSVQCFSDSATVWSISYIQLQKKAELLNQSYFIDNLKLYADFRAAWYSSHQINIKSTSYDFKKFLANLDHKSSQYTLTPNKQKSLKGLSHIPSQKLKQTNFMNANEEYQQKKNTESSIYIQTAYNKKRCSSAVQGRIIKHLPSEQNISQNFVNLSINHQKNKSLNTNRDLFIEVDWKHKSEDYQQLNTKKSRTTYQNQQFITLSKNDLQNDLKQQYNFYQNKQNLIDIEQQKNIFGKLFHKQEHKPKQNTIDNDKQSIPQKNNIIKLSKPKIKRGNIRNNIMQVQSFFQKQECQLQAKKNMLNKMMNQQYKRLKIDYNLISNNLNDIMNDNLYNFLDENQLKKIQSSQNQNAQRQKCNIHDIFKTTQEQFDCQIKNMRQQSRKMRSYSQKYPEYNIYQQQSLNINHLK